MIPACMKWRSNAFKYKILQQDEVFSALWPWDIPQSSYSNHLQLIKADSASSSWAISLEQPRAAAVADPHSFLTPLCKGCLERLPVLLMAPLNGSLTRKRAAENTFVSWNETATSPWSVGAAVYRWHIVPQRTCLTGFSAAQVECSVLKCWRTAGTDGRTLQCWAAFRKLELIHTELCEYSVYSNRFLSYSDLPTYPDGSRFWRCAQALQAAHKLESFMFSGILSNLCS